MENSELSLPAPAPAAPVPPTPRPENPFAEPTGGVRAAGRDLRRRIGGALAALVALAAKFWAVVKGAVLLLPKFKLLTTAGTAFVSVAAYSLFFGWTFAVGFVVLLFVHEMGHVIQLRREGLKATAPMFIPFLGAVVMAKSLGENALAEARVGLAGPVLGTAGSGVCLAIAEATNSDLLRALAYIGFFLNLINLVPLVPFDGGRAMAAMAPVMWFIGLGAMVALLLVTGNPFLLVFILLGGMETWRRWKLRNTRSLEQAAYYRVSPRNRLMVGAVYIGLIVLLAFGMHEAHILASGAHSFSSV
ncbi:MAG TPA: site-2 protease family protein [Solirubrobacteraceae bacterium]|jgi:Zn-dependent protease